MPRASSRADRLRLASELIDSVEGPADPTWADRWTTELRRRSNAADDREALAWYETQRSGLGLERSWTL